MEEEAVLLVTKNTKDEDGFPVASVEEIPIFVREKSVMRAEFYEALRAGVQVKTVLETRAEDWEQSKRLVSGKKEYASQIRYDGEVYNIARTYRKGKSTVEIICS